MKLKIKNLFVQACFVAGGVMALTSCNDFLDREPLSSVTPEVYFSNGGSLCRLFHSEVSKLFSFAWWLWSRYSE